MAKWSEKMAYDMETERMKKAILDIIGDSQNRKMHGDPADDVDEDTCPDCGNGCGFDGCDCWLDEIDDDDGWVKVPIKRAYYDLFSILRKALDQAQDGKGSERHGNGMSFVDQPAMTITRAVGRGFPLGQAMKKIQESQRMDDDAAKRELLGAINYLAAAILSFDE